jgi:hypothetical protein
MKMVKSLVQSINKNILVKFHVVNQKKNFRKFKTVQKDIEKSVKIL